jgi:hypothetical protein
VCFGNGGILTIIKTGEHADKLYISLTYERGKGKSAVKIKK